MERPLILEYWEDDGWFVGRLKEVPAVFSQGETLAELDENIRDAFEVTGSTDIHCWDTIHTEVCMPQTIEAVIDEKGSVRLMEAVSVPSPRRALVTILEEPALSMHEAAILSEGALAEDWNRPEEDAAWSHLQQAR